jgi:hypothetical protein
MKSKMQICILNELARECLNNVDSWASEKLDEAAISSIDQPISEFCGFDSHSSGSSDRREHDCRCILPAES